MSRVGRVNSPLARFFGLPPVFLSLLSGVLIALTFLPAPIGILAWIALIPFFAAIEKSSSRGEALLCGFAFGGAYFFLSIAWLRFVTFFGWFALTGIETSFIILLSFALSMGKKMPILYKVLWAGLAWTACEFFRAELPVFGFGWNLLGYSQWAYSWVLQFANLAGVYGLSFVIVLFNCASAHLLLLSITADGMPKRGRILILSAILISVLVMVLSHGIYWANRPAAKEVRNLRVSVLQGNVPEELEWNPVIRDKIIAIYSKLTELAHYDEAELIIWPEAAYPGYFNRDIAADPIHALARTSGIPMIVGAPHFEAPDVAYNSAYFLGPTGEIKGRYDKQKLVPFGEYVPLKPVLGWLEPMAHYMGVSNFMPGTHDAVFPLMNGEFKFSVLICFEDTFQSLARKFVDKGADFLVVITNDSWFKKTSAPYQHMYVSMFRAVENGVPVIRAANTGVSDFISPLGKEIARLRDEKGRDLFTSGRKTIEIPIDPRMTFYRKGGWLFGYVVFGLFVILLPFLIFRRSKLEV